MRTGLTISGAGHAAVLLWSVLTLAMRPYHADTATAVPIDVISTGPERAATIVLRHPFH